MISERMQRALNEQLNAELYSSYLYLSMEAYFEGEDLPGFARWMRSQAQEELVHGMMFFDHINMRGVRVTLKRIEVPETEWSSPLSVFDRVYSHERKVTGLIHDLVSLAMEEKDYATNSFLQWFVSEQVEEEESSGRVLAQLRRIGEDLSTLHILDREMSERPMKLVVVTTKGSGE